jgi:hypothetical protein
MSGRQSCTTKSPHGLVVAILKIGQFARGCGRNEGGRKPADDAEGKFATVYSASQAEAAFGEVIARYRERPGLLDRIDDFLTHPPDAEHDPLLSPGVVPEEFFDGRWTGHPAAAATTCSNCRGSIYATSRRMRRRSGSLSSPANGEFWRRSSASWLWSISPRRISGMGCWSRCPQRSA